MFRMNHRISKLFVVLLGACQSPEIQAQLQITEVMFDSRAAEPDWEWFEVWNAGVSEVDLDGAIFDDYGAGNPEAGANIVGLAAGGRSTNTRIPAGGVAVIYNGSALEFTEPRFRTAWNLPEMTTMIGVEQPSHLNNGGDAFGIWSNLEQYDMDLANIDEDAELEVASFDHALVALDYTTGFPSGSGASIRWNGMGDIHDGANWFASEGPNSTTSVETFLANMQINNVGDIGNPGVSVGAGVASGLLITELMYNPASDEPEWEWIEVYNGTGEAIDFVATPYFLDDAAGNPLNAANLSTGSIAAGEVAVLYHGSLSPSDIQAAWGENINFVAVDGWPGLNNGGDTIGIWSDPEEYALDSPPGGGDRTFDGAIASVAYLDGSDGWPNVVNGQAISLIDLEGEINVGNNWIASFDGDGDSRFAEAVISSQLDHLGGDFGTPGVLDAGDPLDGGGLDFDQDGDVDADDADLLCAAAAIGGAPQFDLDGNGSVDGQDVNQFMAGLGALPGDVDLDGAVQFADFLILSNNFGGEGNFSLGDIDCDGRVQFADFLLLSANFGLGGEATATVPETTCPSIPWAALAAVVLYRRRRS